MGLSIMAVNKNYGFTKCGDDKKKNETFGSTDIGYIGYKIFRDNLIKFASDGRILSIDELELFFNKSYFHNDKTFKIALESDFATEELKDDKVQAYIEKLKKIKSIYPKVYDIIPLVLHCDCEGEIPFSQIKPILPILNDFHKYDKSNYGYSGREYNFTEDLIEVIEEAIKNKGKLYFC